MARSVPTAALTTNPVVAATPVVRVARDSSGQSRRKDVSTLEGAGTRNEATQPWRTANSATMIAIVIGASGGRKLRTNLDCVTPPSPAPLRELRTAFAFRGQTAARPAVPEYGVRVGSGADREPHARAAASARSRVAPETPLR